MRDELNIIEIKLDRENDESWRFVGAFKWNSEANDYLHNKSQYAGKLGTIRPYKLPENYDTYFQQFEYCIDCDTSPLPDTDFKFAYLVKKKHFTHRNDSTDRFHFDCILPTIEDVKEYCKYDMDDYVFIQLKLSYDRNKFFTKIHNEACRSLKYKEGEYFKNQDRNEKVVETNTISLQNNKLTKLAIVLLVVNIGLKLFY